MRFKSCGAVVFAIVVMFSLQLAGNRSGAAKSLAASPGVRPPRGIVAMRDLEYARVDGKSMRLDIYGPRASKKPLPLVVWIHGGAWQNGDKRSCLARRLADQGYVVASINYRLSHEAIFPAQIYDCKAAIRWLRANAGKYHIDPNRIGVWGASAGGHLAALLGTSGDVEDLEGSLGPQKVSSRVQAVCDYYGPTDLIQMDAHAPRYSRLRHDAPYSPESRLIGGPIQQNKEKVARANPIRYVSKDDPPFLIVHGDRDPIVPIHQSKLLKDALAKQGVDVSFSTISGAGHGFGRRRNVERMVEAFFAKHLKSAPPTSGK